MKVKLLSSASFAAGLEILMPITEDPQPHGKNKTNVVVNQLLNLTSDDNLESYIKGRQTAALFIHWSYTASLTLSLVFLPDSAGATAKSGCLSPG